MSFVADVGNQAEQVQREGAEHLVTGKASPSTRLVRQMGHASVWLQYRRLITQDLLPRRELEAIQERRCQRLLAHAYATVPHYRDVMDDRSLTPGEKPALEMLQELPILTKADIVANFPDRMLSRSKPGIGAQHLASTGTTADRTDVMVSPNGQRVRLALVFWRHLLGGGCTKATRRIEIPPDACSRLCGTENGKPLGLMDEIRWAISQNGHPVREVARTLERRVRSSIRHSLIYDRTLPPFGPDGTCIPEQALQKYVDAIQHEQPYLVTGLPAYLQQIARHIQRSGQKLRVPVVHPMGGLSSARLRQFIARSFGSDIYETYGSSELGGFACQCSKRQWLHVAMGSYIVEIIKDGRPAAEGELGHIIVTGLDNWAMPFIRYKLGDVGKWHAGPCSCGRPTQLVECNGRLQNLIVTQKGKAVTEEDLMDLIYFDLGLEHFQLIERKRGRFDLSVVPQPGREVDVEKTRLAVADLLGNPRSLDVFPVATIHAEATGKFRFVKSASYELFE